MKVKNKTGKYQKVGRVKVRPWRTKRVPDGANVNLQVFEIVGKDEKGNKKVVEDKTKTKTKTKTKKKGKDDDKMKKEKIE